MSTITTETLWLQLSDRLRLFLRHRVPNDAIAEDLLQECFLRIHQKLDTIQEEDRLVSWVYQIARNLIADHFRKQYRSNPPSEFVERGMNEECKNLNHEISQSLNQFLSVLPEKYRQAIELYEWEGLSQAEIADRLGLSLSAAKSRLQRGRQQLKKLLTDCCHFEQDRYGNIIDCDRRPDVKCTNCND